MRLRLRGQVCDVCGKRRYATEEAASLIIARKQGTRAGRKAERRAYFIHGWWHVTSKAR